MTVSLLPGANAFCFAGTYSRPVDVDTASLDSGDRGAADVPDAVEDVDAARDRLFFERSDGDADGERGKDACWVDF